MGSYKNKLHLFLNSICPVSIKFGFIVKDSILEFIFIFLFVFIFKPYVIIDLSLKSLSQVSFITAFIFSFFSWVYNILTYKKINLKSWTFKKDIIRYAKAFILNTLIYLSWAYYAVHFIYQNEISSSVNLFSVGLFYIIPIGVIIYFFSRFIFFLNLNFSENNQILFNKLKVNSKKEQVLIYGKNKEEVVKIDLESLLFIKSIGHYIKIVLLNEDNKVEVKIIRNSLNNVAKDIIEHNKLFQCHRSYIINLNMIKKIEGNSQKAVLIVDKCKESIPLSRKNYKYLKEKYAFSEKS
ncbi:LytTR family DNA-binding domain-containing protein [Lutibacter sp.]|uniref:LytTR family DNA-binding domain-containing protein n=1 Tax=Lutibacter sp. TaxID=1925666 RepID=UPI0025B9BC00|nr:LytTR family DNA-binding domain-containing protein [Lutibacter sp.]MCF6182499.1 LytTR family transcriptional regulator [Lutibacter sp.]